MRESELVLSSLFNFVDLCCELYVLNGFFFLGWLFPFTIVPDFFFLSADVTNDFFKKNI